MEKEEYLKGEENPKVKIMRGQRGTYGWEITIRQREDETAEDLAKRFEKIDSDLRNKYTQIDTGVPLTE